MHGILSLKNSGPLFVASQLLRTTVSNTSSSHLRASLCLRPNSATIQAGIIIIIIIAPLSQTRHTRPERGKRYITLRYVTSVRLCLYSTLAIHDVAQKTPLLSCHLTHRHPKKGGDMHIVHVAWKRGNIMHCHLQTDPG